MYIKQLDISYNYNSNKLDISTNKYLPDKLVSNKHLEKEKEQSIINKDGNE